MGGLIEERFALLTGGDFQQNIPNFELHFDTNIRRNDAFAAKKIGVEFKADGQRNDVVQQSVTQTNALLFREGAQLNAASDIAARPFSVGE